MFYLQYTGSSDNLDTEKQVEYNTLTFLNG